MGEGREKAQLFFNRDSEVQMSLKALDFVLTDNKIFSRSVAVKVFLGEDSLTHPSVQMRYDDKLRRLILFRSEQGVLIVPF